MPKEPLTYSATVCSGILTKKNAWGATVVVLQQAQTQNGEQESSPRSLAECETDLATGVLREVKSCAPASAQGTKLNAIMTIQINQLKILKTN